MLKSKSLKKATKNKGARKGFFYLSYPVRWVNMIFDPTPPKIFDVFNDLVKRGGGVPGGFDVEDAPLPWREMMPGSI